MKENLLTQRELAEIELKSQFAQQQLHKQKRTMCRLYTVICILIFKSFFQITIDLLQRVQFKKQGSCSLETNWNLLSKFYWMFSRNLVSAVPPIIILILFSKGRKKRVVVNEHEVIIKQRQQQFDARPSLNSNFDSSEERTESNEGSFAKFNQENDQV